MESKVKNARKIIDKEGQAVESGSGESKQNVSPRRGKIICAAEINRTKSKQRNKNNIR